MKNIIYFALLFISAQAFSQTWVDCLSTDSTHIYNVFQGKDGGIGVYAEYLCDSCPTRDNWMIAETKDNGKTWKPLTTGKRDFTDSKNFYLLETYFFNKDTGVAIGNFAYRTVNGGKTWSKLSDLDTNSIFAGARMYRLSSTSSINYGNTIVKFDNKGFSNKILFKNLFVNGGLGFGQKGGFCVKGNYIYFLRPDTRNNKTLLNIYKSNDLGETWTIIKTNIECTSGVGSNYCIAMQTETEGMISIPGVVNGTKLIDGLFRFKNDSVYYKDTILIDSAPWHDYLRIIGIHFYNNCEGVLTTYQPYHYKTINGGETWIRTEIAQGYNFKEATFFDSSCVLYYAGYDFGLQKTHLNVSYNRAGPPYPNASNTTCKIDITGLKEVTASSKVSVMPNPFNNTIRIVLNYEDYEGTVISLFDNTGKLINTIDAHQKVEQIITNDLATGLYILSVATKGGTEFFKMIKY